jgi:hypothetical protein
MIWLNNPHAEVHRTRLRTEGRKEMNENEMGTIIIKLKPVEKITSDSSVQ